MGLEPYDKLIDQIAQNLHNGTIKPSDLNVDLIQKTYADLSQGAAAGVGKKWETQYKKEGEDTLVTALKKNLYTFASAKTFAQLETLNKMLYYQDGKLRPFNEYSQLVKKVNAQYNKNWLQAEHQTAKTAGQMAVKWQRIQRDKDLFPNLKYRTVGDERVRDEHAALNGTIKPVDDPFWSTHYPPNGWRCFLPETLIFTINGWKEIQDIQRGDWLIGGSGNKQFVGFVHTNTFNGNLVTLFSKRKQVACTPNHRFFTQNGWVMSEFINCGDIIIQVGKIGLFNKIMNAVHNTKTLFLYGLMSFKRKRKSVRAL